MHLCRRQVYGVIMIIVYVAGFPLGILAILLRNRKHLFGEGSEETRRRFGFLYEVYGPTAWWWEVEELVRKLLLTSVAVLFDAGSPLQLALAVMICWWAHVLHGVFKPWTTTFPTYRYCCEVWTLPPLEVV